MEDYACADFNADHNFTLPEIVGNLRKVSDNLTLIELVIVNNRALKAWLPSLPCRTNMAASVYCSGKVLRTFARNCQSRNVNTCKYRYLREPLSLNYFFIFRKVHVKREIFQTSVYLRGSDQSPTSSELLIVRFSKLFFLLYL